jgi:hypothetical protein
VKIAHFQVDDRKAGKRGTVLTKFIEGLKGVAGVVMVRSMGLMTVLYDERRTDPVTISDEIVRAEVSESLGEPEPEPDPPRASLKLRRRHEAARFDVGLAALRR